LYIGASVGKTANDSRTGPIDNTLALSGYSTNTLYADDKNTGWKALVGYSFNEYIALEGSYADFGDTDIFASLAPPASFHAQASLRGASLDLVGTLPLGERFSAFARLGVNRIKIDQDFSSSVAINPWFTDRTDRGTNHKYGFGLEYDVTDNWSLRAEAERFHIDTNRVADDKVDMFSIGLVYRFGRSAPAAQPVVQAPAPARAASPPPPPPPPPAPQRAAPLTITLEASALFGFDRSDLTAAGRTELDELVREVDDVSYEVIVVTGHTDRIGSRDYNLDLSNRRASTVRDYLVSKGIPSGDITARGVGMDQPVTTAQQCQGQVSDALKACLQPDRRVEVDLRATRDPE
jgi:OOP family OmpA-OmpF porin